MKRIGVVLLLLLLAGCDAYDSMKDGFTHTQEVASDLEKSVGSRPFVGFNWANGILINVSITFDGIPPDKSTTEIATLARNSIAKLFKQEPTQIVIGFTLSSSVNSQSN